MTCLSLFSYGTYSEKETKKHDLIHLRSVLPSYTNDSTSPRFINKHLEISRVTTVENSPLHTASSRARTGNLWFRSTSR